MSLSEYVFHPESPTKLEQLPIVVNATHSSIKKRSLFSVGKSQLKTTILFEKKNIYSNVNSRLFGIQLADNIFNIMDKYQFIPTLEVELSIFRYTSAWQRQ